MTKFVKVARYGETPQIVEATDAATVEDCFEQSNVHPLSTEKIQDLNGNTYTGTESAAQGVTYYLVQNVKSGC